MGSSASTSKKSDTFKHDTTMICSNCSSPVNLLTKRRCELCHQYSCMKCLSVQFPFSKPKICPKCLKLQSGKFNRNDLEVYSIKELRQFLSRSKISLNNCFEKSDLVALVLKSTSHEGSTEDSEHRKHVLHLKQRMERELLSNSHPVPSPVIECRNVHSDEIHHDGDDRHGGMHSSFNEQMDFRENVEQPETSVHSDVGGSNIPLIIDQPQDFSHENVSHMNFQFRENIATASCPNSDEHRPGTGFHFKDPVKLEDITDLSQVELLNVRQMKELLTRNFVNYKGCCERNELSGMVVNLCREHSRNTSYENLDQSSNMCKICMDQVIDCVLLECGHMVACKTCGKQLAECPICRKYVSRVVHVFRA